MKSVRNQVGGTRVTAYLDRAKRSMQHIRKAIEELRDYIAKTDNRDRLEDVDSLLGVALLEIRSKLAVEETEKRLEQWRAEAGRPH